MTPATVVAVNKPSVDWSERGTSVPWASSLAAGSSALIMIRSGRLLDRDGGIDGGLTDDVRHAEGNEPREQACEQTSNQEVACGNHAGLSGRGSRAGGARRGPTHGLQCRRTARRRPAQRR